ncbi:MBL fold metallo-hydrolase [Taibaiella koreensis]|uniref:MBL fold metallo-hydrolase n=1 Tax=Taibaiella koreensis TaxID=1268548 RepID=UPI000E59B373|nr:MBL fold metallo-hydrolase [Taibaiella koreensis]
MTQIFPLSEGTFTIGHDKIFQPFNENSDELNDRPVGSLLVEVQPFAVVNDRDVILLDTGLGFNNPDGQAHLPGNLAQHHIHPDDVTKVLLSHLHKDHAGGLDLGLFPNATFYVYREEMAYARQVGFPSYYVDDLLPLLDSDRVQWLEGESGLIDGYIEYIHTDGHCPQHIVFKIPSEEGIIFYGGDEAPQYKQMKMKYVAKYDYDGKKAMHLREQWAEQGAAEGWRFLFYHDVTTPVARL